MSPELTDAEKTGAMNKTLRCQEACDYSTNKKLCWSYSSGTFPRGSVRDKKRCVKACDIGTI